MAYLCINDTRAAVNSKHSGNFKKWVSVRGLLIFFLSHFCLLCPPCHVPLVFHLPTWQFLFPLHCLRSAQLPREVATDASMWCLKVGALQELLGWVLPTPAMLGSCYFRSAFVATVLNRDEGWGTQRVCKRSQHNSTWAVGITRESCGGAVTCVPHAATSHSRSYRGTENLGFMESSGYGGIGCVFSRGTDVLPWTCHGVEQMGGSSLRMCLASALGMLMGTSAKCFKMKCMLVSCMGRAVLWGNGQCFECRGLSKLTFLPEKEEHGAEEREWSWKICVSYYCFQQYLSLKYFKWNNWKMDE